MVYEWYHLEKLPENREKYNLLLSEMVTLLLYRLLCYDEPFPYQTPVSYNHVAGAILQMEFNPHKDIAVV